MTFAIASSALCIAIIVSLRLEVHLTMSYSKRRSIRDPRRRRATSSHQTKTVVTAQAARHLSISLKQEPDTRLVLVSVEGCSVVDSSHVRRVPPRPVALTNPSVV